MAFKIPWSRELSNLIGSKGWENCEMPCSHNLNRQPEHYLANTLQGKFCFNTTNCKIANDCELYKRAILAFMELKLDWK